MSARDDLRLLRFTRGELRGAELEAFEAELDQNEALREALGELLSTENAPTVQSGGPAEGPATDDGLTFVRELGRGGMATVSLAVQHGLEREVAVKRARPDRESEDAQLVQEARLTGALEHPAIVPVHALARDERGRAMVVLKRVEGEPWSALLRQPEVVVARFGRPALEWHLRVLATVCDALAFAHARGTIHRDVKPANVMIGTFGEVYLTDWGLGGLLTPDPAGRLPCVADTPGSGTPAYMAPEQLELTPLTPATDVWLAGACLFEVLYGRPPFLEWQAPGRECVFEPGPRADLLAVAKRALAPEPTRRFATMLELKQAIEQCLRHTDSEQLTQRAATLQRDAVTCRGEGKREEADALATEAAHTLRAAQELWPRSETAQEVSAALLAHRVEWALEDQQPDVAQRLLTEHPQPPAALASRVKAAVAEQRERDALARGLDPAIGRRQRVTFLIGVVVMMVVFNSARLLWPAFYASRWSLVVSSAAFLVGFVALGAAHRALLASSKLNWQLSQLIVFTTIAQLSTRTTAAVMGWSRAQALVVDLSVIALTLMIGAGLFHWSFGVGAVVCLAGQVVSLALPRYAEPLFGLTSVLAVFSVALGLIFWRRPER